VRSVCRSHWLALVVLLFPLHLRADEPQRPKGPVRHAGVEVGGKGVKLVVIEVAATPLGPVYRRVFSATRNTSRSALVDGKFTEQAVADTAQAVADFVQKAREAYQVPAERIHVVLSSGVPRAANRAALEAALRRQTGLPVRAIDEPTEVMLSFLGIVPRADRARALNLDVGGGNTTGGYVAPGQPPVQFSIPYASVTWARRVEEESRKAGLSFREAAERLREGDLIRPLKEQAAKMPGLATRDRVYLSGGAVWALATLLYPEQVGNPYVPLKAADLAEFRKRLWQAGDALPLPDLDRIADEKLREEAKKDVAAVRATFTVQQLQAAGEVLAALAVVFELEKKTLLFPRNAAVGWLSAYILGEGGGPTPKPPAP
jgi:hypothetical protein